MSESEPIGFSPAQENQSYLIANGSEARASVVAFNRAELGEILSVYGRMVARGEWRDYGIDMLRDRAVFYIFRNASERPLYRAEKQPKGRLSRDSHHRPDSEARERSEQGDARAGQAAERRQVELLRLLLDL